MSGLPFWVEVLGRRTHDAREVLHRHKFEGRATIGRGYGNDVILDDPYVAPEHLRVSEDDNGHLWVEDLGSANGSIASIGSSPATTRQEAVTRLLIADEANLTIGHTQIRIRDRKSVV